MAATLIEQRSYAVAPPQLFGACVTALGQMRAQIEAHDIERGTIRATIGAGPLGPVSELALAITSLGGGQSVLVATWRARKRGGDRRVLAGFLEGLAAALSSPFQ